MIREANIKDIKDIQRLITILEEKEYDTDEFYKIFYKHLQSDTYFYYVYEENNKVSAVISLLVKETLHHCQKTGEILELCVDPRLRGQKIGAQLLNYVENIAFENHFQELELSSNIKRKDAHRFYERHQYQKDHFNFTKKL